MSTNSPDLMVGNRPLSSLRVVDLKQELEKRGLSKSGSKKDLADRLRLHLQIEKHRDSGASADEEELPNYSVHEELADQNPFIRDYLASQAELFHSQKVVKKLVEEEAKRESETSADEGVDSPVKQPPVLEREESPVATETRRQSRRRADSQREEIVMTAEKLVTRSSRSRSPAAATESEAKENNVQVQNEQLKKSEIAVPPEKPPEIKAPPLKSESLKIPDEPVKIPDPEPPKKVLESKAEEKTELSNDKEAEKIQPKAAVVAEIEITTPAEKLQPKAAVVAEIKIATPAEKIQPKAAVVAEIEITTPAEKIQPKAAVVAEIEITTPAEKMKPDIAVAAEIADEAEKMETETATITEIQKENDPSKDTLKSSSPIPVEVKSPAVATLQEVSEKDKTEDKKEDKNEELNVEKETNSEVEPMEVDDGAKEDVDDKTSRRSSSPVQTVQSPVRKREPSLEKEKEDMDPKVKEDEPGSSSDEDARSPRSRDRSRSRSRSRSKSRSRSRSKSVDSKEDSRGEDSAQEKKSDAEEEKEEGSEDEKVATNKTPNKVRRSKSRSVSRSPVREKSPVKVKEDLKLDKEPEPEQKVDSDIKSEKQSTKAEKEKTKSSLPKSKGTKDAYVDLTGEEALDYGEEEEDEERTETDKEFCFARRNLHSQNKTSVAPSTPKWDLEIDAKNLVVKSHVLNELYLDIKLVPLEMLKLEEKTLESSEGKVDIERKPSISQEFESDEPLPTRTVENVRPVITRTVSIVPASKIPGEVLAEADKTLTPPRNPQSNVLLITNLTRPFTLPQLKEMLQRTGNLVDIWVDKIKSKCIAKFDSQEEAFETRAALHGVRWPTSNPKSLHVDYSSQDILDDHKAKENGEQNAVSEKPVTAQPVPVREWDMGKKTEPKSPGRIRKRSRSPSNSRDRDRKRSRRTPSPGRRRHSRSPAHERRSRAGEGKEPEPMGKALDELFKKTIAAPSIYWLPLTAEQIAEKEELRRKRMLERERRLAELNKMRPR